MEKICTLPKDINRCTCFDEATMQCMDTAGKCGFLERKAVQKKSEYVRKERWYEKYYR